MRSSTDSEAEGVKILVVDDEASIRDMVQMSLELAGYDCFVAADATTAHAIILDHKPDLMLLDWMMPGTSGMELLARIKKDDRVHDMPVIMLTAKDTEDNKIQGLETGADDYMVKPFSTRELRSRIKAVLRRASPSAEHEELELAGLRLDKSSHRVFAGGEPLDMGPTEFKLLTFFMSHAERAYTRSQLLDQVWGSNVYVEERTVDVHIRRLRKALETPSQDYSGMIQTVRGTGYRFSAQGL